MQYFLVTIDLVHDFMNFNVLKIMLKFIKKIDQGRIWCIQWKWTTNMVLKINSIFQ